MFNLFCSREALFLWFIYTHSIESMHGTIVLLVHLFRGNPFTFFSYVSIERFSICIKSHHNSFDQNYPNQNEKKKKYEEQEHEDKKAHEYFIYNTHIFYIYVQLQVSITARKFLSVQRNTLHLEIQKRWLVSHFFCLLAPLVQYKMNLRLFEFILECFLVNTVKFHLYVLRPCVYVCTFTTIYPIEWILFPRRKLNWCIVLNFICSNSSYMYLNFFFSRCSWCCWKIQKLMMYSIIGCLSSYNSITCISICRRSSSIDFSPHSFLWIQRSWLWNIFYNLFVRTKLSVRLLFTHVDIIMKIYLKHLVFHWLDEPNPYLVHAIPQMRISQWMRSHIHVSSRHKIW